VIECVSLIQPHPYLRYSSAASSQLLTACEGCQKSSFSLRAFLCVRQGCRLIASLGSTGKAGDRL